MTQADLPLHALSLDPKNCDDVADTLPLDAAGSSSVSVTTIANQINNAISVAIANAVASVGASKCTNCGTTAGR